MSGQDTKEFEILNLIPMPVGIAHPVFTADEISDFELVWMNKTMLADHRLPYELGERLTHALPDFVAEGGVTEVLRAKTTGNARGRVVSVKLKGQRQIARVVFAWHGNDLIFTVLLLSHVQHNHDDAIRAASIITQIMPKQPIAYSVRAEGDSWVRFPANAFLQNLGMTEDRFQSEEFFDLVHPDDVERVKNWTKLPVDSRPLPKLFRMITANGDFRWVELWSAKLTGEGASDDQSIDDVVILRDIDELKRLQAENEELNKSMSTQLLMMSQALDASQDGFAIWKAVRDSTRAVTGFRLEYINHAGSAASGREPQALVQLELAEVVGVEQSEGLHKLFHKALHEGKFQKEIVPVDSPTGWIGAYENTVVPFGSDSVMTIFRDVSEERRELQQLLWLTEHDYLTGIPNRAKLEHFLEEHLNSAAKNQTLLGFVFIDIDHFKNVNDIYGHDIGDSLLVNFAKRIRHSLPESVLVARIAGDEFAIVMPELKSHAHLVELMDEVFHAMQRPFNHNTPDLQITCSAGCVLTDGSEKGEEVMRFADKVMYQAKFEGRNRYLIDERLGNKL